MPSTQSAAVTLVTSRLVAHQEERAQLFCHHGTISVMELWHSINSTITAQAISNTPMVIVVLNQPPITSTMNHSVPQASASLVLMLSNNTLHHQSKSMLVAKSIPAQRKLMVISHSPSPLVAPPLHALKKVTNNPSQDTVVSSSAQTQTFIVLIKETTTRRVKTLSHVDQFKPQLPQHQLLHQPKRLPLLQ